MSAYAPVSRTTSHSRASSVPSRVTAVLMTTDTAWRVIVRAFSSMESASLTGRRTRAARAAASGSVFV